MLALTKRLASIALSMGVVGSTLIANSKQILVHADGNITFLNKINLPEDLFATPPSKLDKAVESKVKEIRKEYPNYNQGNPLQIHDPLDLTAFAKLVNSDAKYDFSGKRVELQDDIDLEEFCNLPLETDEPGDDRTFELTPEIITNSFSLIGTVKTPFKGTFDGNGKTITGMGIFTTAKPGTEKICGGLFGYILDAEIKNLTVGDDTKESSVVAFGGKGITEICIGGLIGCAENSRIENCKTAVSIFVDKANDKKIPHSKVFAGGILGLGLGAVTVVRCSAAGNIFSHCGGGEKSCAGGILGASRDTHLTIEKCKASGNISSSADNSIGSYAGGIVGAIDNRHVILRECYASGNVGTRIATPKGGHAGAAGIVGRFDGANEDIIEISMCCAEQGEISAFTSGPAPIRACGLFGELPNDNCDYTSKIVNCHSGSSSINAALALVAEKAVKRPTSGKRKQFDIDAFSNVIAICAFGKSPIFDETVTYFSQLDDDIPSRDPDDSGTAVERPDWLEGLFTLLNF
ncbi:MAG: hypothetical protein LBJ95_00660 [Oscillospiraceae bacterium]|nr:hypothetical protein [Oscillospiraceae bacterium]